MRVRNPLVVLGPDGKPLAGAKVETKLRPSGTLPSVYAAETGSEPAANPGTTDVHGKVNQWLERGAYESLITGLGMEAYAEAWDAAPAGEHGVDHNWLEVTLQAKVDQGTFVPGDLKLSAVNVTPTGWLKCEGQAVSRATYAALFAALGTAYGAGDGSTSFNVPDYRERVPIGTGPSMGVNAKGGESTHTLTATEMPSHSHSTGKWNYSQPGGHVGGQTLMLDNFIEYSYTFLGTEPAGGGGAHNNMQPYTSCVVLIKT